MIRVVKERKTYALRHSNEYMQAWCSARPLGAVGAPTSASGSHWKKMVMLRVAQAADASPPQNVIANPPRPVTSKAGGRGEKEG
jgi:hypothetical protein